MAQAPSILESAAPNRQPRSERTMQRILDSAEKLILDKGLADASIPEIARRARSSVGGIYARFKDKRTLLLALEERFFHRVWIQVEELAGSLAGADIETIIDAAAARLVAIVRGHQRLVAAFVSQASSDAESLAKVLRFRNQITDRIAALLRPRIGELSHPDPELAIALGVQFAFSLMIQFVIVGEVRANGRVLSDEELQAQISRNFLSYVGA
jgi:AcrR family transcriptional regulator